MKLAERAREHDTRRDTAYEWFHAGILPVEVTQLLTGTTLGRPQAKKATTTAVHARVASADPKSALDRQVGRLVTWAADQKLAVGKVEIGKAEIGKAAVSQVRD